MGIEVSTFISGLTPSWPPSGDPKNQGDDHLRLIKGVLQATFPNASKAFYFPASLGLNGPTGTVLTAANDKAGLYYTTAGGDATVTLPSGLTMADSGWSVEVIKYDVAANAVMVVPASGLIYTQFGAVASVRVGSVCAPVRFVWSGAGWFAHRHGPVIGSTMNFDGPTVPPGYFTLDGSTFSGTTFTELAAALGTTTLRDKRGRVEAGVDSGAGRLTATYFGATAVNGAVGGVEAHAITNAELATHRHSAAIYDPTHFHTYLDASVIGGQKSAGAGTSPFASTQVGNTSAVATGVRVNSDGGLDTTYAVGGGGAHRNVQHTIVTQKLIRSC